MAVDTHTHLQDVSRRFVDDVLASPIYPVVVGYSMNSNRKAVLFRERYSLPIVLGIAPQTVVKESSSELEEWLSFVRKNKPNAVGEVGSDYKWATKREEREEQERVFRSFIALAKEMSLPLVIHCRDAYDELIAILEEENFSLPLVMHSFFGKKEHAHALLGSFDAYLSINTIRTKEKKKVISEAPLERLVVETDSPYIAKSPLEVVEAIRYIAEVKELSPRDVEEETTKNACRVFCIEEKRPSSFFFD